MKDLVTIITVCRNAREDLAGTVRAVTAMTYRPLEYVIVDGASKDGSLEVIQEAESLCATAGISCRWVSEPDGGIYDAMNKAVGMANGLWLNFMNAGDLPASADAVERALKDEGAQGAEIIYGNTRLLMDFGTVTMKPAPLQRLHHKMVLCHQATFIRASLLHEHPYDLHFPIAGDYEFIYWCYVSGKKFHWTDKPLACFESEHGKSSQNRLAMNREFARINGRDKTLKWKVEYTLKALEVGINKVIRTLAPSFITDYLRRRNYERLKRQRDASAQSSNARPIVGAIS